MSVCFVASQIFNFFHLNLMLKLKNYIQLDAVLEHRYITDSISISEITLPSCWLYGNDMFVYRCPGLLFACTMFCSESLDVIIMCGVPPSAGQRFDGKPMSARRPSGSAEPSFQVRWSLHYLHPRNTLCIMWPLRLQKLTMFFIWESAWIKASAKAMIQCNALYSI